MQVTLALDKLVSERFPNETNKAKHAISRWVLEVLYQESSGQNIAQIGGGPGRGLFQYELAARGSGANKVCPNFYLARFALIA